MTAVPARSGEIDALRALAMLSVVALHARLLPCGWIGVWLFFVISGYVVTLSILEQHSGGSGMARLGGFLRRRLVRIVPVYYAFIALGLIVAAAQGVPQDALGIASLIGFFDNIGMIVNHGLIHGWPSGHLWTLSVEMQFYALYGVALCLLPRQLTQRLLVAVVVLCPVARAVVSAWLTARGWKPLDAAYAVYAGPGLHFDSFAMGCLLAFAHARGQLERVARAVLLTGCAVLLAYVAVYVGVNHFGRGVHGVGMLRGVVSGVLIGEHREVILYSALGLAGTGLVAAAAARDRLLAPLLSSRALQWVGEVSYGGYLFHALALWLVGLGFGAAGMPPHGLSVPLRLLLFVVATALTLVMAWGSFRWFEVPLRRALSGRRPIASAAMPPVAA